MSLFWSLWITVLTLTCLALVLWVLLANRKVAVRDDEEPENRTTGHVYDGIEEYDNPLPRWWFYMFILSMIYAAGYLVYYPGLGSWKGTSGWTSHKELAEDQEKGRADYAESYDRYSSMSIEELAHDDEAMKMGTRLFSNNCAVCHSSDGGGNFGIPNLTDKDWLHGGTTDKILETITGGRNGVMPAWGPVIGEEKVEQVAEYVLKVSGQEHDEALAAKGQTVFTENCAVCHGNDAKGKQDVGSANLTDSTWLYSGTREGIIHTVRGGLNNRMPAQKDLLREEKIHVLAAYVYSLSLDAE